MRVIIVREKMEENMEEMMQRTADQKEREQERELQDFRQFLAQEDGMGTVEIILIIVVLVGLVLIFKDQITSIVNNIFSKITRQTNKF